MSMLTGVTERWALRRGYDGTAAQAPYPLRPAVDVDASAEDLIPYISNDKKMRGNHMTLII